MFSSLHPALLLVLQSFPKLLEIMQRSSELRLGIRLRIYELVFSEFAHQLRLFFGEVGRHDDLECNVHVASLLVTDSSSFYNSLFSVLNPRRNLISPMRNYGDGLNTFNSIWPSKVLTLIVSPSVAWATDKETSDMISSPCLYKKGCSSTYRFSKIKN